MEKINQQGVTLIELMITVAIAAILVSVAVPSFQQMIANNRVESTAEKLRNSILHARNTSIKKKSGHSVVFDVENSEITGWRVGATNDPGSILMRETVNDQVEVKENNGVGAEIKFDPYGYIAGDQDLVKRIFAVCEKEGGSEVIMGKAVVFSAGGMVMIKNANQSIENPNNPNLTINICP